MLPHGSISRVWAVSVHLQDIVYWHVSWNMWVFNPLYSITWSLFVPLGKYWIINCSILSTFACLALLRRLRFDASFYYLNSLPDFSTFPSSPWPLQFTTFFFFFTFSKCSKGHWFITLYVSCVQHDIPTSVYITVCSPPKFSFHPSLHSWCSLPFHLSTHQCHMSSGNH